MLKDKKKVFQIVGIILIVLVLIFGIVKGYQYFSQKIRKENLQDLNWLRENVVLEENTSLGENIYSVKKDDDVLSSNLKYQEIIDEKIGSLISDKDYTFSNPLLILNPYGTNTTGLNIYFSTDEEVKVSYEIQTDDDEIDNFSRSLKGDEEYSKSHAYQIIGLVPENKNTIKIKLTNESGGIVAEEKFEIDLGSIKATASIILEKEDGESTEELSDGLFAMLGHDKAYNANTYLYSNDGILRSELVLEGYRSDRIIFYEDDMLYSYKGNGIFRVNRLGKVVEKYTTTGYKMHHDYILDEENSKLLILANENGTDTIEDVIISLDLENGEVEKVIDFKYLLPDMFNNAVKPEVNTYGGDELDWIHFNSLSMVDENDIVLSARELSTIIYVENIYEEPTIKYMIADPSVYDGTDYLELLYDKKGEFVSQAGQHTITYIDDNDDNDSTYYLTMYNNNYQGARTRPDFDWSAYPGTGNYQEGEKSMYYQYLVNEEDKTYELVKEISLPYSSIVSSVEDYKSHFVTSSGMSHVFDEYDKDGKLIAEFKYTSKKYAYRVFKYSFDEVWFN